MHRHALEHRNVDLARAPRARARMRDIEECGAIFGRVYVVVGRVVQDIVWHIRHVLNCVVSALSGELSGAVV